MMLVAAAPLAFADTHHIVKGAQGPRASAVTWNFVAPDYGMWSGHIVNSGLRSLVVDVEDNSAGVPESVSHERIRFAAHDAFPTGEVDTLGVPMAMGHAYLITVTPNGPRDSFCDVEDVFDAVVYPTASFSASVWSTSVYVDGSASSSPDGSPLTYAWDLGDGSVASTVVVNHTYAVQGIYLVALTVTNSDGMTDTATQLLDIFDAPPVASFTASASGLTVSVDASGSTDDFGIVSYAWNWGDGTTGTGKLATHTYMLGMSAAAPSAAQSSVRQPLPPHNIQGYTVDSLGNPIGNCEVTITDTRTGEVVVVYSDPDYGWYEYDLNTLVNGWMDGDLITVGAIAPGWSGSSQAIVSALDPVLDLNVVLYPGVMTFTVTLTVTDALGQTDTMALDVQVSQ
jgi:chitodextrinase